MSNERYHGRDLTEIRENLIKDIKKRDDTLTQFSASDPGSIIIDSVAKTADDLNYYIDQARLERYIATCKQRDSVFELARLTSYFIKGVQPPSIQVELSSSTATSGSRLQFEIDSAPYCIVSSYNLDSTNSLKDTVTAYNGILKTVWVPTYTLDLFEPKINIGSVFNIPSIGIEVQVEIGGTTEKLTRRGWYASRTNADEVEIILRDNRVISNTTTKVFVSFIEIAESDFKAVKLNATSTLGDLTIKAITPSTTGSGSEDFEESKRNVINNSITLGTLVSVADFEALAEQDLEVKKAKAFDFNSSVVTIPNKCVTYIELKDTNLTSLPVAVADRLNAEVIARNTMLGSTYTWELAPIVTFNIVVDVKSYATDQIDVNTITDLIRQEYLDMEFGEKVIPSKIAKLIERSNNFIEYVDITSPASKIEPNENQIPRVGTITVTVTRGGLYD